MVEVAESDAPPDGYYEKDGDFDCAPSLRNAVNKLRDMNGIANKLVIVPSAVHEAYTNMEYISLSGDYMAIGMAENYHGYDSSRLAEDLDFVIQHEIGHLNVHPGVGTGWKKEIKAMPVEGRKRGLWSNILSDIEVNYNISQGTQLKISGKDKEVAVKRMNTAVWAAYGGGYRNCLGGDGPPKAAAGQVAHRTLLESGKLVDNRYNAGVYEPHAAGNPYLPDKADTPFWQTLQGHGRGPQLYPSISYCLSHKMPVGTDIGDGKGASRTVQDYPDSWKRVKVMADVSLEYDSANQQWFGYNTSPGVSPINESSPTVKSGRVSSGTYTVLACRTYDGLENPKDVRPIQYLQLDVGGTPLWIPAHYCMSLCPHCGQSAASQFEIGMAFRPGLAGALLRFSELDSDTLESIENSRLFSILLNYLLAGLYANADTGYKGVYGPEAGKLFLYDVAYDRHLCMIGQ
jgi:hypothetical protein